MCAELKAPGQNRAGPGAGAGTFLGLTQLDDGHELPSATEIAEAWPAAGHGSFCTFAQANRAYIYVSKSVFSGLLEYARLWPLASATRKCPERRGIYSFKLEVAKCPLVRWNVSGAKTRVGRAIQRWPFFSENEHNTPLSGKEGAKERFALAPRS